VIERRTTDEIFMHLIFGVHAYAKAQWLKVPNSLRRALNALSFAAPAEFPKTLVQFIERCHQPVNRWYPLDVPDGFDDSQPILYEREFSEEAVDYYLDLSEKMEISESLTEDIPQTALDNLIMIHFRQRLKESPDQAAAQHLYVEVRSFLITHSWITLDQLREQLRATMKALAEFYEEMPSLSLDQIPVCDRCGLLVRRGGKWRGIKPSYCADHGAGSPYIRMIRNVPQLYRLKGGVQLRTFIPGRVELALFTFADSLHAQYPEYMLPPERYPGLDTYDLRLSFADGDIWAVDAKDHRNPERLAKSIRLPYGEGDLNYSHCFYVIPDARVDEDGYWQRLENAIDARPGNLLVSSVSEFQSRIEEKVKSLTHPSKSKKGK
jgi:hypothetical protein